MLSAQSGSPLSYFIDTAPTEIYTLSLHDALPISSKRDSATRTFAINRSDGAWFGSSSSAFSSDLIARSLWRSEEHTSELQSHVNLVCRLLLEKKKARTHARPPAQPPTINQPPETA